MKRAFRPQFFFPALAVGLAFLFPGVVSAQESPETKSDEPAGAAAPATQAPAAEVTPAPEATPAPEVSPEAKGKKKKKKKESESEAQEAPKSDWHAGTPADIADRLVLGTGFGLGSGSKKPFSSDHLGFHLYGTYPIPVKLMESLELVGEARFVTHTGVKDDLSFVAKSYLVGTAAEYSLASLPKWTFVGNALLGLSQITEKAVVGGHEKSQFGGAFALGLRAAYSVFEKIEVVPGCGLLLAKSSWMDVSLGVQASF